MSFVRESARDAEMRIVVVGTSGAGKTMMAKSIASMLDLPCIELDSLNWASNWQDLSKTNPDEFTQKVRDAISADAWVSDGNYADAPYHNSVGQARGLRCACERRHNARQCGRAMDCRL
jgi:ATPase family associated with various cellular activities (AAA)